MSFEFINNTDAFKELYQKAVDKAWEEIGLLAEGHAKKYCSVDTGRLRSSINHATVSGRGEDGYSDTDGNAYSGMAAHRKPARGECYIGTNVDYAIYQEFGTSKIDAANHNRGFLLSAITDHMGEYRTVMATELGALSILSKK